MDAYPDQMTVEATLGDGSEEKRNINIVFTKKSLGVGQCGHVVEANITETGENVAVKRMDVTKGKDEYLINEIEYLKTWNHNNIVKLLYHFETNTDSRKIEFLLMENLRYTLHNLYNIPYKMPLLDIKLYIYQLIRSVGFIHNQDICHRDIKPKNLLINIATGVLKLCDFGSAKNLSLQQSNSPRTGTRQYHAPELLLGFKNYTKSVDLWAVGCILVELLRGQHRLFRRQPNTVSQLGKMIEVFGTPEMQSFDGLVPAYDFSSLPQHDRMKWADIMAPDVASDDAILLCNELLHYNPNSRILPHAALAHTYFDQLRSLENKFIAHGTPLPPLFNFQPGEIPDGFDNLVPSHLDENDSQQHDLHQDNHNFVQTPTSILNL